MRLSYDLEALLMCTQNFFGLFAFLEFLSLFNQELIHSSPKFYYSTNCLKHFSLYIDLDQYFHWLSKWDQSLISALFYHYWTQWIWALIKKKKYQKSQEVLKQVDIFLSENEETVIKSPTFLELLTKLYLWFCFNMF